jgi:hypothetical protein
VTFLAAALALFFLMSISNRQKNWRAVLLAMIATATLLTFSACGGGGGGGGGGPQNPGTPVGVDPNVVISISGGGVSHSIPLTVNVQ